jgi:hypothetical protein
MIAVNPEALRALSGAAAKASTFGERLSLKEGYGVRPLFASCHFFAAGARILSQHPCPEGAFLR